jgi:hypothetical protein
MSSVARLLTLLAPLVMGALGRAQRQQGIDAGSLEGFLSRERERAERAGGTSMGALGQLLDQDGDGQVADDVARMGMSVLGSLFKK